MCKLDSLWSSLIESIIYLKNNNNAQQTFILPRRYTETKGNPKNKFLKSNNIIANITIVKQPQTPYNVSNETVQ